MRLFRSTFAPTPARDLQASSVLERACTADACQAAAKYAAAQLESYIHRIRGFFKQADVQQSGTLSWDEFKSTLEKPKVRSYFEALDLDLSQAHVLFDLLDTDQSGSVTVEEFIEGCVRLRGHARSIDVNKIVYMCERMFDRLPNMLE